MVCSHLFNSKIWVLSGRHTEPINHLLDTFEKHIWMFKIGVKNVKLNLSHHMCHFSDLLFCPLRCFPWVWSLCPMMTGSTRWTRGCGMEWASYPLQPPPCCERRGSCQRPRAAATAHHQTGAQGSSHLVPCAGVHVCVCVHEWGDQGLGTCITLSL